MNIRLAAFTAYAILKQNYKQTDIINVRYVDSSEITAKMDVSAKEAAAALRNFIRHIYPLHESKRLKKVITCDQCRYYKTISNGLNHKYKKRVCAHGSEQVETNAMHYCGYALERIDDENAEI